MEQNLARRNFIKTIAAGSAVIAMSSPLFMASSCRSKTSDKELFKLFTNPPAEAKPVYRWWWNGNRITKEEVIRELEIMHSAGAGGVEINPIEINDKIVNPSGKELQWLSDEWIDVLQASNEKGNELGMISDMIIGTGWPFGGKFLADEETIQGHDIYTEQITGPATFKFNKNILNDGAEIKQAKLIPVPVKNLNDIQDITDDIQAGKIKIPAGNFEISIISWRNKFREVVHGAPGGDGPVLDHFNKSAVEKYLQRTSDGLKPAFGNDFSKHIRSMFCDSIELEGANWTEDFGAEFEKRNDYNIWEYLPLILNNEIKTEGDFADTILRVRYDYYSTLSQLFMERFVQTFNEWCKEIGVKSRYQAYGYPWIPTDLLDGNMMSDIPEGDQWLFNGGWTATQIDNIRYAIFDKYSSSAAHLRGLKISSCEAMTNTAGVFSASLEYIKQATDINIVAGVNHLVLHGWNYSPKEAGFPGWIRFGTYFSEQNPWFPYLKNWSDYTARISTVFQNSQAVSQVAIIGPTADHWGEKGLDRNPFLLEPWYLHSIWLAMRHHGYFSHYLNTRIFVEATYENGNIKYGPMNYRTVIICGMETALPEFIDSLTKYAETGGKIIFIGKTPYKSPGMKYKGATAVKEKMDALLNKFSENVTVVDEPISGDIKNLKKWTGNLLLKNKIAPGLKISTPDERLYLYQAENSGNPVFFFSNQNCDKSISFDAEFERDNLYPWKWDAETGEKSLYSHDKKVVSIRLKPLESLLLVFSKKRGKVIKPVELTNSEKINLTKNWTLEFFPVEGDSYKVEMPGLRDISKISGLDTFGGTIIYRTKFSATTQNQLDLGKVAETAEVTLNGNNLGVKYWGERVFDISEAVIEGENILEIKVTTLLWNYCNSKTMKENPMAKLWADKNQIKDNKPLPVGLIGPVVVS